MMDHLGRISYKSIAKHQIIDDLKINKLSENNTQKSITY